jgi:hypothetical protein
VPVERIEVRVEVGTDRMAASDDPLFLRLGGPGGRDFRLDLAKGRTLRRGSEDVYVLGAPGAAETNVAHPELNDPTAPALHLGDISDVQLVKGLEPLPNVRGVGEMDDRLLVERVSVRIEGDGGQSAHFARRGPIWLGLLCGLQLELPRLEKAT